MATKAVIAIRVNEVYEEIVKGTSKAVFVRNLSQKWGVTSRTLDNYIAQAQELIEAKCKEERDGLIGLHHSRLEALYASAVKRNSPTVALQALRDIAKLRGLNEPERRDITSKDEPLKAYIEISLDDWDESEE